MEQRVSIFILTLSVPRPEEIFSKIDEYIIILYRTTLKVAILWRLASQKQCSTKLLLFFFIQ
jgi:hypothetical protein